MRAAWLDGVEVTADDLIAADDDGVLVIAATEWDRVAEAARKIQAVEPHLSLRRYLAERGGAIEV